MVKESIIELRPMEGADAEQAAVATEVHCRHHWIIESPQGATSKGVCKLCGAIREFRNAAGSGYWEDDAGSDLSRWSRRSTPVSLRSDEDEMSAAPRGEAALLV